jgi:hypothetical protein
MKFAIGLTLFLAFNANALPCEKEEKALDETHKTFEKSALQMKELQKQTDSLGQRIQERQKTCGTSSDAKCNPAEMQMMTGNYATLEGVKQKAAAALGAEHGKEESAKAELVKCLNKASKEKDQKKAQP